eukprot:7658406-Karenia_brevis.AAC.1
MHVIVKNSNEGEWLKEFSLLQSWQAEDDCQHTSKRLGEYCYGMAQRSSPLEVTARAMKRRPSNATETEDLGRMSEVKIAKKNRRTHSRPRHAKTFSNYESNRQIGIKANPTTSRRRDVGDSRTRSKSVRRERYKDHEKTSSCLVDDGDEGSFKTQYDADVWLDNWRTSKLTPGKKSKEKRRSWTRSDQGPLEMHVRARKSIAKEGEEARALGAKHCKSSSSKNMRGTAKSNRDKSSQQREDEKRTRKK